jgi:uncharacterized protein (TIGR02246 family)
VGSICIPGYDAQIEVVNNRFVKPEMILQLGFCGSFRNQSELIYEIQLGGRYFARMPRMWSSNEGVCKMHWKRWHNSCQLRSAILAAVAGTVMSFGSAPAIAQSGSSTTTTDSSGVESSIRASAKLYQDAFARSDAAAIAAMWAENGTYVDSMGNTHNGRAEIQKVFEGYFNQPDNSKNIEIAIDSIRAFGDKAAVEKGTTKIKDANGAVVAAAPYTVVHVNNNGKWEMATVTEQSAQFFNNLLDKLHWMSGEWSAKGAEGEATLSTRWMADRHFMVAKFHVTTKSGESHEDMQVIGVDPRRRRIISWIFDSEGGHGRGVWSTDGKRWAVDIERVSPDGQRTEARNYLEPKGSDAFTWRSTGRKLNDLAIPDSDTITVNRIHL